VGKAVDLELDETIAIKFLAAQFVDEETLGRFKAGGLALAPTSTTRTSSGSTTRDLR